MSQSQSPRRFARMYALAILLTICVIILPAIFGEIQPIAQAAGATFIVTNTDDSGAGSLRQAITDANANPGLDTISFNIGSGPQTITPLQRLPTITDAVVIDGTTQPGFSGAPIIELNGALQPDGNGLFVTGGNSTVRSLVLNGFRFSGVLMDSNGGNRIEGCYIGTDITGTIARSNFNGISIRVSNNVIGGTTPAQRNVISGSSGGAGIDISRPCCTADLSPITGNVIQGNYIGVNAAGNGGISNLREGVRISSFNASVDVTGNMVGGTQVGAGNVISGNHFDGLLLEGPKVKNNSVQGNFIGTDASGSFAIPNDGNGVSVSGSDNLIGGPVPGARNIISGNGRGGSGGNGVWLGQGSGNVVQGNVIGANAALTTSVANLEHGVAIGGTNSIVGGVAPGEANVIAFNGYDGIISAATSATSNSFRGNSIFSNGFLNHPSGVTLGIDLGGFGVTPNDAGDGDTGANNLQNFPVITSVNVNPGSVNVKGTLNSTANQSFTLDFYANSVCDALGFGEGARRIGSASVMTDAIGDANFDFTFALSLPANQVLTATATDPAGNTSEFSQCSPSSPAVGSVSFNPTSVTVSESSGFASFDLNRTGGSAGSLTVGYAVTGGTASPGSDFTPVTGSVTFASGETSKIFFVPILDDNVDEPLIENAKVTLSTSGDLDTLGSQSTATLFITDNDPTPTLSVGDVSAVEGDFGTTNFNFPVTLSGPSSRSVIVTFDTADGTAIGGGNDYFLPFPNSITIPPGQMSAAITIQVIGDSTPEPDETFFVNLLGATNANIASGRGKGTILNDDSTPTVSLSINDVSVVEGNSVLTDVAFTVTLSGPSAKTVVVEAATGSGTAGINTDFQGVSRMLMFAPGEQSKTFSVSVIGDNLFEGNETFRVVLRDPVNALLADSEGVCTIIDDEQQPTLSINDISVVEGDSGTREAVFTVSLSGPSSVTVGFILGVTNGTALEEQDFLGGGGGALIPAGSTTTTISILVLGDTITEPNETFFLNIESADNATISDGQAMATIIDDESLSKPPTVQFSPPRPSVSEGDKSIVVEVTRSGDLSAPATVEYATSAQSNASDRSDYTSAFGKLIYAAGESSKTFTVFITDDVFVESTELFLVVLSNPTGGASLGNPAIGVVQIIDNDISPPNSNPSDDAPFFVRQHYHDFLNRQPDASGLAFWTNQITECQQPGATCNADVRRINVSAAFFLSIEFQETGYLVERLYKSAYGDAVGTSNFGPTHQLAVPIVRFNEFLPDTQQIGNGVVIGQPGADQLLESNKVAFIAEFVQRTRFTTAYATTLTPAQFVDALFTNTGVTPSASERTSAIGEFGGASTSTDAAARARALRRVAENSSFGQQEINKAFVLMQYFGYLRRNPNDPQDTDYSGYDFWLTKLNQFNGNFVNAEMVKAFIVSGEYRGRFGP
jgi:Calx-beta domain-containing protein